MIGHALKHPAELIAIVRCEAEFGSVRHDHSQSVKGFGGYDAAFRMTPFWPRVGKQDEDTIGRRRWQCLDQQARVVGENSDVVEMPVLHLGQQSGDPVLEYFATDEADLAMTFGLGGQMLARTKTDFEPDRPSRRAGLQPA